MAGHRFEAWKGAAVRAGAQTALEFAKGWYPDLDLAQLKTFRVEAKPELAAVQEDLAKRAAALAEYADTAILSQSWMRMVMWCHPATSGWT